LESSPTSGDEANLLPHVEIWVVELASKPLNLNEGTLTAIFEPE
jgi:hypothetical protein